jgi:hypothetical protein
MQKSEIMVLTFWLIALVFQPKAVWFSFCDSKKGMFFSAFSRRSVGPMLWAGGRDLCGEKERNLCSSV